MATYNFIVFVMAAWALALFPTSSVAETNTDLVRIVSLAPNLTELVFALGLDDHLVGRSSACDYPPQVRAVPVAGDFGRPYWEKLQSLHPDLVIATDLEKPGLLKQMDQAGIKTLLLPCESWDDLLLAGQKIGEAVGQPERGQEWANTMKSRRTALEQRVNAFYSRRGSEVRPRVYVEVWGDPVTTAGARTFMNDLINLAGGINIAGKIDSKYIPVNAEWVIRENPDAIVLAYMLPVGSSSEQIKKRLGWESVRAVRDDAICDHISPDLLLRAGPRMIEGAEKLADWLMDISGPPHK